jgi:tripartite-type tricarboxylate transporter receptor subunit TctC
MNNRRKLFLSFWSVLALTSAAAAEYPTKPIRLIVPSAAGGAPDITARLMANELSRQMGQQVVVDNRPGASGLIGFEMIARALPDGYTVGYATFPIATNPSMYEKLPYDAIRDFQPVVQQLFGANLLTVTPALPIRSVKDLIEYARTNPDKLSFGTSGNGTTHHLSMELLKVLTQTRLTQVSYKAIQQAIADTIGGQVHVVCDNMPSILPHAKAGRVRAIGVTSLNRSPATPDTPTINESGVPGYEFTIWSGYIVPVRASREIVQRLNLEINKALKSPAIQEKFTLAGYVTVGGTPEVFADHIRKEIEKWAKVIKASGIKPQ